MSRYQAHGVEGLLEGYRCGRPPGLTPQQHEQLGDILDSGPVAYGLDNGVWTSPMIAWVIEEEFGVPYHPGHVRKLLHLLGFSVQRPRRVLSRANASEQDRWHRHTYPNLKKSPDGTLGVDFHRRSQLPTGLHAACHLEPRRPATPSPRHGRPQECEDPGRHRTLAYSFPLPARHHLQRVNLPGFPGAACPQLSPPRSNSDSRQRFLPQGCRRMDVVQIQSSLAGSTSTTPYSPEFNPTERLWQHTRKNGTHNRYFANEAELVGTLTRVFGEMQSHPELICSYLCPFC